MNEFEGVSAILSVPLWLLAIVVIWSLIWKGLALWKAGRKNQPVWFVALLVINTLGILEILYLFAFSEMGKSKGPSKNQLPKKSSKRRR